MKPSVKISENVLKRLSNAKEACFGKLYGTFSKNTFTVVGLQLDINDGINLVHSFPAEVDFCGVFQISSGIIDQKKIREYIHDIDVTDNPLFIFRKIDTENGVSVYIITNEQIEKTNYITVGEQDIYSQFVHIRLRGEIPVKCEVTSKSIEEEFQNIRKNLSSGLIIFTFPKTNVFLLGNENENNTIGISGDPNLNDICEEYNGINEGVMRKKKSQKFELEILDINMLKRNTRNNQGITAKEHAPLCILEKKPLKAIHTTAVIDSLAMIHRQTKISDLYEILLEGAIRHLKLFEKNLLNHISANEGDLNKTSLLQTFHFYPSECGHFLTRLYPRNETENTLKSQRQLLHKQLLLDVVSPVFRRANRYIFKNEGNCNGPLVNPHEGVRPTDNAGQVALVRGKYEYYHYCQNKMDDNGWGCAYRSLQTLASWFKLQGYTDKEVPTFIDIQKSLVDIGDKPSSFVGSKQWIGSIEVSCVLNSLLQVTSKILYVSSGEEMGSKGPELVRHFETQGSPIMIGGGVLAHTILGVDYNHITGDVRFLILDPHYTGGEDLHVIQSKGWCGWKTVDFWEKSAYYNMCLPQVPREI